MAKSVERITGVTGAQLDFGSGILQVEHDPAVDPSSAVLAIVRRSDLIAGPLDPHTAAPVAGSWWSAHGLYATTLFSGGALAVGWVLSSAGMRTPAIVAWSLSIIAGGVVPARRALMALRMRSLDMNVLMTLAVIGAVIIGQFNEGATVLFLFAVGGLLEARALARTRSSVRDLMKLTPESAFVRRKGITTVVSLGDVAEGETVVVRPGERVPFDGVVVNGESAVDEAAITGESMPVDKTIDDRVYAGTFNAMGLLEVRVTSPASDSTIARLIRLVEQAHGQQAPIQRLVDRFTRAYTPAVIVLAMLVAVGPPVLGAALGMSWGSAVSWFYRGLVLLVVGCPCALVISTPVSVVSAITRATHLGVLIKGGAFLEAAAGIRVVAFDKTGTLTCGRPEVAEVMGLGVSEDEVLSTAATLESGSAHPLAAAVLRAAGEPLARPVHLVETPGRGVVGLCADETCIAGTPGFLAEKIGELPVDVLTAVRRMEDSGLSVIMVARAGRVLGCIGLADTVRPEARRAVARLRRMGIEQVVMLTGDNERTAGAVARELGLSGYRARQLPEDKLASVRELRREHGPIVMVGDGINDAAALALADIGVSMSAAASDVALESADVALLGDDLEALPAFIALGRRTRTIITQNIVFSIAVKLVVLLAAVVGYATLWMAVFADTGVSLLVIINGLRLLGAGRPVAMDDASAGINE